MHSPLISVIIPSVNGLPYIDECLKSLARQEGNVGAEVIVLNCRKDGSSDHIKKYFPQAILFDFAEPLSIPELRAIGMSRAKGDIIAITEDHCIPREDWYKQILKAHESEYAVVGGAVENGSRDSLLDWAVFLCEYSGFMPPIPYGEVDGIAGNNASYKKWVLEKVPESRKKYYWEYFMHEELRKSGIKFLSAPSIVVTHKKEFGFLYFFCQRFHYSRSFAGMRRHEFSIRKRVAYILLSPLLLLMMLSRILKNVVSKKKRLKEFALSLPYLIIFMISYVVGEFVGYLFGPGSSLIQVE